MRLQVKYNSENLTRIMLAVVRVSLTGHCDRGGQGGGGGGSARASRNVCGASARARPRIAHRHARHANTRFSAPRHNSISAAPADQVTHFRPVWMDISLGGKWPWLQQRNRLIKKPWTWQSSLI